MIVGIAGLGPRGRALGSRLRAAGERVVGYDSDIATAAGSGLRTVGTAEKLAQQCELELVAADGDAAEALIRELLGFQGIANLQGIALCGALDPRRVKELASEAAGKGIALLDAPVDGGEPAIQAGDAVVFAGGSETAVEDFRTVLRSLGTLVYVGEAGSGQIARTVNDLLRWANVLAISDAFSLVRACGADPTPIREAVLRASGSNRALERWGRDGALAAEEDIQAALELARETGASMPFLQELDSLLGVLDADQMAGLFNLGIADLSAHETPELPAEEEILAEPAPLQEVEAPLEVAAEPEPGPEPEPEPVAIVAPEPAPELETVFEVEPKPEPAFEAQPEPEVSFFGAEVVVDTPTPDHLEPALEEPAVLESFGVPAGEADEGWDLDMAESEGEPKLS